MKTIKDLSNALEKLTLASEEYIKTFDETRDYQGFYTDLKEIYTDVKAYIPNFEDWRRILENTAQAIEKVEIDGSDLMEAMARCIEIYEYLEQNALLDKSRTKDEFTRMENMKEWCREFVNEHRYSNYFREAYMPVSQLFFQTKFIEKYAVPWESVLSEQEKEQQEREYRVFASCQHCKMDNNVKITLSRPDVAVCKHCGKIRYKVDYKGEKVTVCYNTPNVL